MALGQDKGTMRTSLHDRNVLCHREGRETFPQNCSGGPETKSKKEGIFLRIRSTSKMLIWFGTFSFECGDPVRKLTPSGGAPLGMDVLSGLKRFAL